MSDVVGYIDSLTSGEWLTVADAAKRGPWECVIEWPGPANDLPYFELVRIDQREDGDYDVTAHFLEGEREWTATFKPDDRILFVKKMERS